MASPPFAHPFPVEARGPDLGSRNECVRLIRYYQVQGHMHPCVHAQPVVIETGRDGSHYYGVRCARDSFDIRRIPVTSGLGIAPRPFGLYGCPTPCHFQQSVWQARGEQLKQTPSRLLVWFRGESWHVKVAVLAIVAAVFLAVRGPETIRALAELVRAITGK